MNHGLMDRMPHDSGHHSFASRDYADMDCKATGCKFNIGEKCAVPTMCKINDKGGCDGFTPKQLPKEKTGD